MENGEWRKRGPRKIVRFFGVQRENGELRINFEFPFPEWNAGFSRYKKSEKWKMDADLIQNS